jgi:hypothetical protein
VRVCVCTYVKQGDEPTAFVTYERLEAKILELLEKHSCDPDGDDTLLQVCVFRVCVERWRGRLLGA